MPRFPPRISVRRTVKLSDPMHWHAARAGLMTSESSTRKLLPVPSPPLISPWIRERLITTSVVLIDRSQLTILASMTVPLSVTVQGPVYALSVVPSGTPVLPAFGKAPPDGPGDDGGGAGVVVEVEGFGAGLEVVGAGAGTPPPWAPLTVNVS